MARLTGTLALVCALGTLLVTSAVLLGPRDASAAQAPTAGAKVTISTDELVSQAPFMGLGVELDPYDSLTPTPAQWGLLFQRLDFMHPGFLRVIEPALDYFGGYGPGHVPVYRWTAPHVQQLLTILGYAQSRGIPVVLGDWSDPAIGGNAGIPAGFIAALRGRYGFTVLDYYDPINEPNDAGPSCPFTCWSAIVSSLSQALGAAGLGGVVKLTGPDDANSWDDTAAAQAADRVTGLDSDNPLGGDSWVTRTLDSLPSLIGAYDSHRYATIWGIENGVYEDQMRARREQISNLDSPRKPYLAGEVGMTARQVSPFSQGLAAMRAMLDPSATASASGFIDSQPDIATFAYGAWMGDMAIQGLDAGLAGESAWDLDDAMHTGGGYGSLNLKRWGFWNLLGGQDGYPAGDLAPRPSYDAWSVLSRAFPAGARILLTPSTGVPGLRVAAAALPAGGRAGISLAVVDDSNLPQTITLTVPAAARALSLTRYDYLPGDDPTDSSGLPVPAETLKGVRLARGLTLQLPGQGLIVLTSDATIPLTRGLRTLLDPLTSWRMVRGRSRHLRLDRGTPPAFDGDGSRAAAAPRARQAQFVIYRAHQISSFQLDAYARADLGLRVYGSPDGATWAPLPMAATNPAPTVGGGRYLSQIVPGGPVPAGTNRLKIVLSGRGTELGQVEIHYDRLGPACLAASPAVGASSIGQLPLGTSRSQAHWIYGAPSAGRRAVSSWCVIGGGELAAVFSRHAGVSLIATTAGGARVGEIGPGTAIRSLLRHARALGLRNVGGGVLLVQTPRGELALVLRAGRVRALAVASPALLAAPRALLRALRATGL